MSVRFFISGCVLSCLCAFTSSVEAADLIRSDQVINSSKSQIERFSWQGAYSGILFGTHDAITISSKDICNYHHILPASQIGLMGGLNFQINNNLVAGLSGDIAVSNIKYSAINQKHNRYKDRERYSADINARLGYNFDRFLPYITAGAAFGSFNDMVVHNTEQKISDEDSDRIKQQFHIKTGYNLGAGLDYAATDHLIFRAEYNRQFYKDLIRDAYEVKDKDKIEHLSQKDKGELHLNNIRVGVAYKF